jgi:peptidoglycan/xylan/chitin deacetylase (PgdA/CDA1 family)
MKTYKSFFRGCIYSLLLFASIWQLSIFTNKEDNQLQPTVSVEYNQQLASKEESDKEEYLRKKKASTRNAAHDNSSSEKGITVLMYHYTAEKNENYMSIPKDKFREQMKYLKDNGFKIISLDEMYACFNDGVPIPDNAVVITFDDGYANNYYYAFPVLKELGFKATIFAITSKINQPQYLTEAQIKELDKNGVSIESHTVSHPQLGHLPYSKQIEELKNSKSSLESILGRDIKYIAYPYGEFNNDTLVAVKELKYKMGVTTVPSRARKSNGIYTLDRIAVRGPIDMQQFKALLNKK